LPYQIDLGPQTLSAADRIQSFDPDSRWQKVADVE
jgi:hypothetical protein